MEVCKRCYWVESCKWGGLIGNDKNEYPENKFCKNFDPDNEKFREKMSKLGTELGTKKIEEE